MCSELFDVDSVCTLDPTLLLPAIDYPIAPKYGFTNSIIVSYILDKSETKRKIVDNIRKHKHIEKHFELYPPNRKSYTRYKYSVEEWLYYISNASFIVTDSYHGMLFSIIFKRQFLVLGNERRGMERFISLLDKIGLLNRLIPSVDSFNLLVTDTKIDYNRVEPILENLRSNSLKYIKQNICSL